MADMVRRAVIWGTKGKGQGPAIIGGDNDARLFYRTLLHQYNYDKHNIRFLVGKNYESASTLESLEWLERESSETDSIIFFYSGHGNPVSAGHYSHSYLDILFQRIAYARLAIILECCFSGNAVEPLADDKRLVIGSTAVNDAGYSSPSSSIFMYQFVEEAMKRKMADDNHDGVVSLQEAFNYYHSKDPYRHGVMVDNYGMEFIP